MSQISSETINIRLIDNLIQVIRSLSSEEQMVLKSKLLSISETPESENIPKQSIIDILNEAPRQQLFQTAEEVDRYLQQERESWDN
jgi:hypothetical protein